MEESEFVRLGERLLGRLQNAIEEARPELELDLEGGILTIELPEGENYLINLHRPNRQIWLSSPRSGAWHFALAETGVWRSTRGREEMIELLARELGIALTLD